MSDHAVAVADRRRTPDEAHDVFSFFDVSIDMLCIRDVAGNFSRVSRSWETTLQYPVEALEGRPLLPLVHPDDVEATRGHMERVNRGGEVHGFVNRYRRADGEYRQLEWRARRSGELIFAVARDVTDRLALEAQMVAAREAAEAANRAKSDFLANMSHEIRTPLNGVIGIVDALARTDLTPAQRELVGLIEGSGVTLERLVSDLLDMSKVEAGQLEIEAHAFDLGGALDGVVETARVRAADKGLEFVVERGARAQGRFLGDSTRIRQVLTNLLSNAVKFTATGGVRVRIEVADAADGATLTLEVADSGVGFSSEQAAMLFQRFSQADTTITRRFGGSGLGLSICKSLVELMGGEITARSRPGEGSVFRVVLPTPRVGEAESPVEGEATAPAGSVAPAGLRVLLAEDHPVNQRVAQLILAAHGAEVTTVADGSEALAAFAADRFDVVLMDMQMPVMDGLTATRTLREMEAAAGAPRTPLIMLSANAMERHREEAAAAGADLHLAKPITAAGLVAAMDGVLPRRHPVAPG